MPSHAHHPPEDAAGSAYTVDWPEAADRLAEAATTDADWYATVAARLISATDRLAIDVGCGGAGMATALARAMTAGEVLAVDGDPTVLATAQRQPRPDSPATVSFLLADLDGDLADIRAASADRGADVVWASASVHHAGDQQQALTRLADLLAPHGRLALAEGGLPVRRLPWDVGIGEPGLEIRLDAAQNSWFTTMRRQLPGHVPMPYGWTEAMRSVGLTQVRTFTTLFETPIPLADAERDRVVGELTHHVQRLRPAGLLDPGDLAAWDRLLDPDDPAWLGHRTDLQRITARSVHIGFK